MKIKKVLNKLTAILVIAAMILSMTTMVFAEESSNGYIKMDLKAQANGLIYYPTNKQADINAIAKKLETAGNTTDYLLSKGTNVATRLGIVATDFAGRTYSHNKSVPMAVVGVSTGTDKEAVILQNGAAGTINLTNAKYDKIYFMAVTNKTDINATLTLNYEDGSETREMMLYGKDAELDVNAHHYISPSSWWGNQWGSWTEFPKGVIYTVDTDESKVLNSFGLDLENNSVAILAVTGEANIAATLAYVEAELAKGAEYVEANKASLEETVEGLVGMGVDRDVIAGIDALNKFITAYAQVDIKAQANGLIYFGGTAQEAGNLVLALANQNNKVDYLNYSNDGTVEKTRMGLKVASAGKTVDVNGVPLTYPAASTGADKEAVIIQNGGTATVDMPDGIYDKVYIAAFANNKDTTATLTLNYADGTVENSINVYGKKASVEGTLPEYANAYGTEAAYFGYGWTPASSWTATAYMVLYTIDADDAKVLESFTLDLDERSVAIMAVTGEMCHITTKRFVEGELANGVSYVKENEEGIRGIIDGLKYTGINEADIKGISILEKTDTAYTQVDIKAQANGLIYFGGTVQEAGELVLALANQSNKVDYLNFSNDGTVEKTRMGLKAASAGKTVNVNGVPLTYPAASTGADKEAIILQNGGAATVDMPDGIYDKVYIAAFANNKDTTATLTLNYADGTVENSIDVYGKKASVEGTLPEYANAYGTENAYFGYGWTPASSWTTTAYMVLYTIDADEAKVLESFTLDLEESSVAIMAVTGSVYTTLTKDYVEEKIVDADNLGVDECTSLASSVELLKSCGVDVSEILGVEELMVKLNGRLEVKNFDVDYADGKISVSGTIVNDFDAIECKAYVVLYKDNTFVELINVAESVAETADVSESFTVSESGEYTVKVIILESLKNLKPLLKNVPAENMAVVVD